MNKSQIITKIKTQIKNKKHAAELAADLNMRKAMEDLHFRANASNIAAVQMQTAKLEIEGSDAKTEYELLRVLLKDRAAILKKLNIGEADLIPKYSCKKCSDSGVFENKPCACYKTLLNKELAAVCGGGFDSSHTFKNSNIKLFDKNENMKKAYVTMQEYCVKFPASKYKTITLVGAVGIGKSYLVECMCNEFIIKNFLTQFVTAFNFNNTALKYHTTFDESKSIYIDSLIDPDVLVVDDLGTEPMLNNVTKEYLFLILNERQQSGKTTIITTNLSLDELLNKYSERIFSRITNKSSALLLSLKGDDLRLKKV